MDLTPNLADLHQRIHELENENASLKRDFSNLSKGVSVIVPDEMKPLFDKAQETVNEYFRHLKLDPTKGTIEINDQRYLLVRASALSKDFLDTIQSLYADRGEHEALSIGKNFLFDISHVIGMNDAKNFHAKMNLTDPMSKLSAGPVHFAYTGWAFVDIMPESSPSPDENFFLTYHHPYSFEAASWQRSGKKSDTPICIMNAGYSSGWCEESFGIPLTAVEVSCTAKGDDHCTFIMSPPHKIQEHLENYTRSKNNYSKKEQYEIPTFFDRKRVEEEMQKSKVLAEESAKSKSDFVANMSHELRTPLGTILGFSDLLRKTELSAVQKDYLDAIRTSGNSLLSIINNILDLSKLDAGKFIIEEIPFSITELLHSVQVMFAKKAQNKKLHFTLQVDAAIHYNLSGDPMRLTQILMNLIGNAIKFTEQGSIEVSCITEEEDEHNALLRFSIKDTGIGIPEDKVEAVFERFTQADSNTTRKYGGTGLGLPITKQLIALLGGSIEVKHREGGGTEFNFTLPYKKSNGEMFHLPRKDTIQIPQLNRGKHILVVEDTLLNQKLTSIILKNNGFDITLAGNGKKAIEVLKEQRFDVILMDIQMPEMDGYDATCMIRDELGIATPIIAMTAHALSGEKEKCIHTGFNDYLAKPFTEHDLLIKISHWISDNDERDMELNTTSSGIVDLSFLIMQTRNNGAAILEMISIFREQNPKDIQTLETAIEASDFTTIYKTAHSLKSETSYFGLSLLIEDEITSIEKLAQASVGIEDIKVQFEKVRSVCAQAVSELAAVSATSLAKDVQA